MAAHEWMALFWYEAVVVERFPKDPIMRYNLACYECQLGRLEQAKNWLAYKARAISERSIYIPCRG